MVKKPKTFITDLQWFKRCRRDIHKAIEDSKENAGAVVEYLDTHPDLRRDLMIFYIKAKERLEEDD